MFIFFVFFFPWKAQIASNLMGSWSSPRSWKATSSREGDSIHSHSSACSRTGWTRMQRQRRRRCGGSEPCAVWSTTPGTPPRPLLTTSVSCRDTGAGETHHHLISQHSWGFFPHSSSRVVLFTLLFIWRGVTLPWHTRAHGPSAVFPGDLTLPSFEYYKWDIHQMNFWTNSCLHHWVLWQISCCFS